MEAFEPSSIKNIYIFRLEERSTIQELCDQKIRREKLSRTNKFR